MPHQSISSIKQLLATDKVAQAIEAMLQTSLNGVTKNDILLQQNRYTENENKHREGIITTDVYNAQKTNIVKSLLAFLGENTSPKKYLTNPPLKPDSHFIGRETELAMIRTGFETNELLMLVNGEGGIGKTTLASKYWYDYEAHYTHLAYLFCEGDIKGELLNKFALPLGIDMRQIAEEKQLAAILDTMAAYPKPCLLILDNANESKYILEAQELFQYIGWHILITSRCQRILPKEQEIAIHHLPPAQAKTLFLQHYSEDSPDFDSLLDKLLQAVGYNTLCVEIFAKTLAEIAPFGENIASLLADIQANGMYLGEKSFEIHTNYTGNLHIKAANSDEIIERLYDLAHLNETEKTLLLRFALLPTENYEPVFLASLFTPENMLAFGKELIALTQKGWLTTNTKTYRLSPVIQSLLLTKEKENIWKAAELVVNNVNKKLENDNMFLNLPLHEAQPYSLIAESLIENIEIENFEIGLLAIWLSDYYMNIGNFNSAIKLLEKAATIYQAIGEEHNYGICLERLGKIYFAQGKTAIAKEYREKNVALREKRYEANPTDEGRKHILAITYHHLGDIYQIDKDYKEAMNLYQKDADLMESLCKDNLNHIDYKNSLAIAYQKIGIIYEKTEDLDNALQFYQKFNQLIKEIYQVNPTELYKSGLAISYYWIGKIFYLKKEYTEAFSFYQKYHQLNQELVKTNPTAIQLLNGLALSYANLGRVYKAMNKISVAKKHFEAAEKIWRELVEKVPDYVEFKEHWEEVKRDLEGLR